MKQNSRGVCDSTFSVSNEAESFDMSTVGFMNELVKQWKKNRKGFLLGQKNRKGRKDFCSIICRNALRWKSLFCKGPNALVNLTLSVFLSALYACLSVCLSIIMSVSVCLSVFPNVSVLLKSV